MKKKSLFIIVSIFLCFLCNCQHRNSIIENKNGSVSPRSFNFQFIAYSDGIDNPEKDARCYYKIYIDKTEKGRTDISLDSQKKYFKDTLNSERHLLTVEKWVLNEKKGHYVKLNNVDQPKPNFYYFELPNNRNVSIELKINKDKAEYSITQD